VVPVDLEPVGARGRICHRGQQSSPVQGTRPPALIDPMGSLITLPPIDWWLLVVVLTPLTLRHTRPTTLR
jgi:hypothetical protein